VGYFIGSPGMNFLECTIEGNKARVDGTGIELDEETAAKGHKAKGKLELGIRPMYLEVHGEAADGRVKAGVKGVEDLGSYRIATLMLAGQTLKARLPEDKPLPGGEVWLTFPPKWTKLFEDERLIN
jgi:glycerol transport system ATP-binding protein